MTDSNKSDLPADQLDAEAALAHQRKSQHSLSVVKQMEQGLARNDNNMEVYFHENFAWRGNFGCGFKDGLKAFREGWQLPFRAAFTDRKYCTEQYLADGDWAACFGYIDALHSGEFMGMAASGKRVRIPYMDFWRIEDGRIVDNPVFVDVALVLSQLGKDVFDGKGWD